MNRNNTSGLTLLELMITLAISGIMAALAIPSFNDMIQNNRMTTHANELVGSLNLARSEAVKRGLNAGLAAVSDSSWEKGWTVWADTNGDGEMDADEDKLREVGEMEGTITATSGIEGQKVISYKADGSAANAATIRLCHETMEKGRLVDIAPSGRIATTTKSCE